MMLRILSMDPGKTNYAIAVTTMGFNKKGKFVYKCEGTRMLDDSIKFDMTNLRESIRSYGSFLDGLLDQPFDILYAERYQARGGKGNTIEIINNCIGYLICNSDHIEHVNFITAATWKNAYNRVGDLNECYADLKEIRKAEKVRGERFLEIHEYDAALIGVYAGCKILGITPFEFLKSTEHEHKLLRKIIDAGELSW